MKYKIVYLFVFIFCLALLSSAKHLKNSCTENTALNKKAGNQDINNLSGEAFEVSPIFRFVLSI